MAIDLEKIERIYNEIRSLTTPLRDLVITARRSDNLKLTGSQKKVLKNGFVKIKEELEAKIKELTERFNVSRMTIYRWLNEKT